MKHIYDLPPARELPRQPINWLRAQAGERPLCFNRPDFPAFAEVQRGIEDVCVSMGGDKTATFFVPAFDLVPNNMSKDCKSWAVREPDPNRPGDLGEDPAVESIPARQGWRCWGCRHLPDDHRVVIRAAVSSLW